MKIARVWRSQKWRSKPWMLGKERWDHPGRDFQETRDSDLITIKERGNSLQNGKLTPGVRRVGNTTEESVYLQNGVSSVDNLGIK